MHFKEPWLNSIFEERLHTHWGGRQPYNVVNLKKTKQEKTPVTYYKVLLPYTWSSPSPAVYRDPLATVCSRVGVPTQGLLVFSLPGHSAARAAVSSTGRTATTNKFQHRIAKGSGGTVQYA